MPRKPKNYIDELASAIYQQVRNSDEPAKPPKPDIILYRMYAVLLCAKGKDTTSEDVHDAWSAWMAGINPQHHSLMPFDQLTELVQGYDDRYRDAIHAVAGEVQHADH